MNVLCPACRSVFRVDPAKVPAAGVRARCSICGTVIDVAAAVPVPVHARVQSELAHANVAQAEQGSVDVPPVPAPTAVAVPAAAPPADAPNGAIAAAEPAMRTASPQVVPPEAAPATREVSDVRTRPVNPYLNNTPELRARRLARALVSDLVAYNPQKREEGLRDGTLRQLFRDEIRKSWDEYVEQVGANVAESTPHFQDALNDVLAGGRRVF